MVRFEINGNEIENMEVIELETDQNHLILFEELIIFKSFLIDLIDNTIKKKEVKKYI